MNKKLIVKNLRSLVQVCPLEKIKIFKYSLIIVVKPVHLVDVLVFLKNNVLYQCEILTCISGVDYPANKHRFKIVYELLSVRYNFRIRVKTFTHELSTIDSCERVYSSANWYECEIWDMFGVFFKNHSNLKRILTDYGFEGYPLRKDFPLSGFIEMRYNEVEKRVVSETVELAQEYRTFSFLSPWEEQKNLNEKNT